MENPFNPGEKVVAVPVPRLDTAIIHVQKASIDGTCSIEGDEFHDIDIAIAAKMYRNLRRARNRRRNQKRPE